MPKIRLTVEFEEVYSEQFEVDISDEDYALLSEGTIDAHTIYNNYDDLEEVDDSYRHERGGDTATPVAWEEV